jgi:Ca-activated chloride channel family protein
MRVPQISIRELAFSQPELLWLLVIPALLFFAWLARFAVRRADLHRLRQSRVLPVRERYAIAGDLPFYFFLIAAIGFVILAVARPHGPAKTVRAGGLDIVILADGSASMRTKDVVGDRWQRSMQFVRLLGDSLAWQRDRVAMALFAHIATPQVRLTKDPNTFFFFLDHLDKAPPFRLEDDTTWDTNLELGIYWGLRVIERDEEMHGKSANAPLFILLSDGEAWSGEVAKSLQKASERQIPVFTVGVGSLNGGPLPLYALPPDVPKDPEAPTSSHLDRESLDKIAKATNGQYFELDRDGDRHIANAIIDAGKRMSPDLGTTTQQVEELYWWFLLAAAACVGVAVMFIRQRAELWIQLAGAVIVLAVASRWLQ